MSSESYSQLLSLAVHEMRTPAGIVGGYLQMLQRAYTALFRAILREVPENGCVVGERRLDTRGAERVATLVIADQARLNGR